MIKTHVLTIAMIMAAAITPHFSNAQGMAVNTDGLAADGSAMLDVTSTSKGMLVPRMSATQRGNISSPAKGLLVYQTDAPEGFYFNSGTSVTPVWVSLSSLNGAGQVPATAMPALTGDVTTTAGAVATTLGTSTATGNRVLTAINAANTGTVNVARLGSGTTNANTFLNGSGAWSAPFTLTTTGSSGAATFSGGTLNIPTPSGGGGSTAPALITDASASPITTDFSSNTTAKAFVVDRNGTTTNYIINIKLPASSNYVAGDIIYVAFAGATGAQATINLFMPGVTNLLSFAWNAPVDVSSGYTLINAVSTSGFKLIKLNNTTWTRIP